MFLCTNPTVPAKDVFNPKSKDDSVNWVIDYSHTAIDAEGWTYGYDNATLIKAGGGDSSRKVIVVVSSLLVPSPPFLLLYIVVIIAIIVVIIVVMTLTHGLQLDLAGQCQL